MSGCGTTQTHTPNPIFSSDVEEYDGLAPGLITLPPNPSLNDVIYAIGIYASAITVPTTYATSKILLDVPSTGTGTIVGDTISTFLTNLDTVIAGINLALYVPKSLYDANTILIATADNTPIPLTVIPSSIVGRKSTGDIIAMSGKDVMSVTQSVDVDGNSVYPYNTAIPYSVGASTVVDKTVLVIKDHATWASNPYLEWIHSSITALDEALSIRSKDSIQQLFLVNSVKNNSIIGALSSSTGADTKNQEIALIDQVGNSTTRQGWRFRKDGADGRDLKIIKDNAGSETIIVDIDYATGAIIFNSTTAMTGFIDEDSFATNSAVLAPSQQSVKAYIASYAAQQAEVDAIETGAGLQTDGSYTADGTANYINTATDLFNADQILDAEVKLINDKSTAAVEQSNKNVQCAYIKFDFSDQSTTGSVGLFAFAAIPDNSIITYARVDVITPFTADVAATTTIGIGVETVGAGTEDIKTAAAIGTDFTSGVKANTWLDYDPTTPFKLTAARDITVNVVLVGGATTLTAGKLAIYLEYFTTE